MLILKTFVLTVTLKKHLLLFRDPKPVGVALTSVVTPKSFKKTHNLCVYVIVKREDGQGQLDRWVFLQKVVEGTHPFTS